MASRVIFPWEGTGWPAKIFSERKPVYACTRAECSTNSELRILREPWQLNCGHRLCKACLEHIKQLPTEQQLCDACKDEQYDDESQSVRLQRLSRGNEPMDIAGSSSHRMETDAQPVEQSPMSQEYAPAKIELSKAIADRAASREIGKLYVTCPFECQTESGSTTRMMMRILEKHMAECKNRLVPCEKCAETVPFSDITEHRRNVCPFRPVDCPNGCGKRGLFGKDLSKHQAECEKKPPICRLCKSVYHGAHYAHLTTDCRAECPFGCADTRSNTLIIDHFNNPQFHSKHLLGIQDMVLAMKELQDKQAAQAGSSTSQAQAGGMTQQQVTAILDRILQLECRSERSQRQLTEKVAQLTNETAGALLGNAGMAESNRRELNDLDALFKVLAGDVHLLTSYDTVFRDLTEKIEKQEVATTERLNKLEGLSNVRLAEIEDQKIALNQFQMTSFNGRLIWRIDNVAAKRNEHQVRHSIYSHPFYTEVYGYKMCARLYFNGDGNGKNSHISLFFVVMKGDFDALLPWPFQQKVSMKLKNQNKARSDIVEKFRPEPSSSSFARPKNEMNIASGCPQFAQQSIVFDGKNGFVVDDTMFIEIMVDNLYEALHGLNVSVQETTRGTSSSAYVK